jgi:putative peptidoglycan lipid II flippase
MASLIRSTGIVALSTLASRILGFIREILFAGFFGATGSTDAFFIAFRIPNLLRRLVAEGALTISFIPVYTEFRLRRGEDEAFALAQKTLTLLMIIVGALVAMGMFFSPEIIRLFAYGVDDQAILALATTLNRIMFPFLFSVSFVAFAMGLLNTHGYFFAPSFAQVLLNVGIIAGILVFRQWFDIPLYGVALGVLFGGILQVLLQVPYLSRTGFRMKVSLDVNHPGIRKIFAMMTPALFGIAIYQINILMSTILASKLAPGSISYLYYSDRLTELVLGIFIVSIGNVLLPEMSKMTATDDYEKLKKLYVSAIRASLFLAIPASVALMVLGFPIVSVIFMRGSFSPDDARHTYHALLFASMGIASVAILRITTPTFYSLKDTRKPVIAAAISFVINISLGYALMHTPLKHGGLALANSLSVTVQMILLEIWLQKKIGALDKRMIAIPLLKYGTASAAMALTLAFLASRFDWVNPVLPVRIMALMGVMVSGVVVFALFCRLLRIDEFMYVYARLTKKATRH